MRPLLLSFLLAGGALAQTWVSQQSSTTASLRGVSAVNPRVVWASGSGGTWLRTTDGGATWETGKVAGAERLDFRGIRAFDAQTAFLVSIGTGESSRIYQTTDGGRSWKLLLTNPDAAGFFDAIAFWDSKRGIVLGDPVGGHLTIVTTEDGGAHWTKQTTPPAQPGEGTFAASNSCLIVRGKREAWVASGGGPATATGSRIYHSVDGGRTWTVTTTPVHNQTASTGLFSLAFADSRHGIAVGGDYAHDHDDSSNITVTADGGKTWTGPSERPKGFRSAVVYVPDHKLWILTGTSGSDISYDGGRTWKNFDTGSFNALGFVSSAAGWAVGGRGRIAKFRLP